MDDSIVARTVLERMLGDNEWFDVVGSVSSAAQALDVVRREKIDIVLLDLEMPGVGGIALLPRLIEEGRGAHVLVVSSAAAAGAAITIEALALGAADALQKPGAGQLIGGFSELLADRILKIMSGVRRSTATPISHVRVSNCASRMPIECLAIGGSTGGIHAIGEFFKDLTAEFTAPILVTQHLPPPFMTHFARQLTEMTGRHAIVARDGERLERGRILIAPGDGHMRLIRMIDGVRVALDRQPAPSRCMPSVDPMLEAMAEIFGPRGLAIVFSGMGRDGTIGARDMVDMGAEILVQDAETSVVWGMPGSIAEAGMAAAVLSPGGLAKRITDRMRQAA